MNTIIEKNIPLPLPSGTRSGLCSVLRKMEIGDSFVIDGVKKHTVVHSSARSIGIKVTIRKINETQLRVWRKE